MDSTKDIDFIESVPNDEDNPPDSLIEEMQEWLESTVDIENPDDANLERIEKNEKVFDESIQQSYIDMDDAFLAYLNNFNVTVQRQENLKLELKNKFFYYIMIFMAAVIMFPYIMVFSFKSQITDVSIITLSITSLAEIMSAIIVLPKIIAKYLFNKKEDDNKIKIISDMQTYNKEKRKFPDKTDVSIEVKNNQ